jgi:hypothetical protein
MNKAIWSFGSVVGGVRQGFRDSGIQLFGNSTFESMIREGIQNSIDAKEPGQDGPVHVAFTLDEFNPQAQDQLTGLIPYLSAGLEYERAVDQNSEACQWYQESLN